MSLVADALRSTRGRIVIGVVVAIAAWKVALMLIAPSKVADGFTPNAMGRVHARVILTVKPERFHVLAMQAHGRVSGTEERSIDVRNVQPADLDVLARPYWVRRVEPLAPRR
jgi:hypothetical protein